MTAAQTLAGAMGCASWRARDRLLEHVPMAGQVGMLRGARSLSFASVGVLGLNEVGVTDLVMATIWRCGPRRAAYAVSAGAEANHLGADIAILHQRTGRILLYQAKLARLEGGLFRLKSKVTARQMDLLRQTSVTVDGREYLVTGRLALYQSDHAPHIGMCRYPHIGGPLIEGWRWRLPHWHPADDEDPYRPDPLIGRRYYEHALASGDAGGHCSPGGVLAAPLVPGDGPVTALAAATTWPWEFDTYGWIRERSPLDEPGWGDQRALVTAPEPEFEPYDDSGREPEAPATETVAGIATEIARRLLPRARTRVYLIALP